MIRSDFWFSKQLELDESNAQMLSKLSRLLIKQMIYMYIVLVSISSYPYTSLDIPWEVQALRRCNCVRMSKDW